MVLDEIETVGVGGGLGSAPCMFQRTLRLENDEQLNSKTLETGDRFLASRFNQTYQPKKPKQL